MITRQAHSPRHADPNVPDGCARQETFASSCTAPQHMVHSFLPRSRAASSASDNTCSTATLVEFPTETSASALDRSYPRQVHQKDGGYCREGTIINPLQTDMAITTALRARQEDRAGNHEEAARLLVASLEYMAASLDGSACKCGVGVRDQLSALKLWLNSSSIGSVPQISNVCNIGNQAPSQVGPTAHSAAAQRVDSCAYGDAAFERAADRLRTTAMFAATRALVLLNQLVILWLVVLGNVFAWAAVQFRNSDLPEYVARITLSAGAWAYSTCKQWNVHVHAVRLGGCLVGWMSSIDKETGFSYNIICSMAAILGAVARVAEESTRTTGDDRSDVTGY
ncbi:hypothetical protein LPJ74_002811 [Coemansia sp. RSA 1843]|nr:hypothetical protein LPJ74_002811 [Coemansia sp. RSA 1843]